MPIQFDRLGVKVYIFVQCSEDSELLFKCVNIKYQLSNEYTRFLPWKFDAVSSSLLRT